MKRLFRLFLAFLLVSVGFTSCNTNQNRTSKEDPIEKYSRPLKSGESALIPITLKKNLPDLKEAWRTKDIFLIDAIENSIKWFKKKSSTQWFPKEGITHKRALNSLIKMKYILENSMSESDFEKNVIEEFDIYQSRGYDGSGSVLFTGYYSPIFDASYTQTSRFNSPLYKRPIDLVTDPLNGLPIGRRMKDGSISKNPTRRDYNSNNILKFK